MDLEEKEKILKLFTPGKPVSNQVSSEKKILTAHNLTPKPDNFQLG